MGCCVSFLRQNHCGKLGKKHTVPLPLHFLGYQTALPATKGRVGTTQTSTAEASLLQATLSCLLVLSKGGTQVMRKGTVAEARRLESPCVSDSCCPWGTPHLHSFKSRIHLTGFWCLPCPSKQEGSASGFTKRLQSSFLPDPLAFLLGTVSEPGSLIPYTQIFPLNTQRFGSCVRILVQDLGLPTQVTASVGTRQDSHVQLSSLSSTSSQVPQGARGPATTKTSPALARCPLCHHVSIHHLNTSLWISANGLQDHPALPGRALHPKSLLN